MSIPSRRSPPSEDHRVDAVASCRSPSGSVVSSLTHSVTSPRYAREPEHPVTPPPRRSTRSSAGSSAESVRSVAVAVPVIAQVVDHDDDSTFDSDYDDVDHYGANPSDDVDRLAHGVATIDVTVVCYIYIYYLYILLICLLYFHRMN